MIYKHLEIQKYIKCSTCMYIRKLDLIIRFDNFDANVSDVRSYMCIRSSKFLLFNMDGSGGGGGLTNTPPLGDKHKPTYSHRPVHIVQTCIG